jgi:hypothetical protein
MRRLILLLVPCWALLGCPQEQPTAAHSGEAGDQLADGLEAGDGGQGAVADDLPCDLSHVSVGQIYRYQGPGQLRTEYRVIAVEEGVVRYEHRALAQAAGDEWIELGQPLLVAWPLEAAPGETREGEVFEVSGLSFPTRVHELASPTAPDSDLVTRTWLPTRGGALTFPPLVRSAVGDTVSMLLVSVSDG